MGRSGRNNQIWSLSGNRSFGSILIRILFVSRTQTGQWTKLKVKQVFHKTLELISQNPDHYSWMISSL